MAKKDKPNSGISSNIMRRLYSLRNQMNGIYKDTYSADPTNKEELEKLTSGIEDNLSKIISRNGGFEDISNVSRLYAASNLSKAVNDKEYINSITDFFENRAVTDQLVASYTENKWIVELDNEIDTVCKYMPKLEEALDAIKDSVLSADNFEKEYLTFNSPNISNADLSKFNSDIAKIKKDYKFYDKVEQWYSDASKYGETFVWKARYDKALSILMSRKSGNAAGVRYYQESMVDQFYISSPSANNIITESNIDVAQLAKEYTSYGHNIKIEINKSGALETALKEAKMVTESAQMISESSIQEASFDDNRVLPDGFEIPKEFKDRDKENTSADGLIDTSAKATDRRAIKVNGVILKTLKRENMILLYIDDICLGYYYLEFLDNNGLDTFSDSMFTKRGMSRTGYSNGAREQDKITQSNATNELLKFLAATIVNQIDDKFINNNAYLKSEIYAILRFNDIQNASGLDRIRVTYLSPDDVEHIKFKEDPETHRGISDLYRSLIPAKLWCCLYISNTLGILTRGQDKRVYYVKQNVEQNIAQTMLNVINQIKKQNFNIMQIENMNSILGITGKYNDYIIPVGPSGDSPVSMEVMEGQNIDPQQDLLDKLEENAVSSTGIPYEMVVARLNLDFATQLTMSNSKFLRFVFKRQSLFEKHLTNIMSTIYNAENETESSVTVNCILPAPLMLNINNLNQIMQLVQDQAQAIADLEYTDTNDQSIDLKKAIFKKNYVHYKLGAYLKQNEIDNIKTISDLEFARNNKPQNDEE